MSTFKASLARFAICSFGMLAGSCANQLHADVCDWKSLNHDRYNTRSNPCENILSPDNVINLQQIWTTSTATPQSVQAAPVYDDGVVYYVDIGGNIFARDALDGTLLSTANLGAPIESAPLVGHSAVYVATDNLTLYALDKTNLATILFQVTIDPVAQATGQGAVVASPVLVDDLVIIGVTYSEKVENTSPNPVIRGSLNAFYANNLTPAWQFVPSTVSEGFGVGFWSTPAVDTKLKLLYVGTTNTISFPAAKLSDSLLAIHYKTGKLKWHRQFTHDDVYGFFNPAGPDWDIGASPNLFTAKRKKQFKHHSHTSYEGKDLVGVCSKAGVYRALDRHSGKLVWETVISMSGTRIGNPSAAVNDSTIYAVCTEDLTYSLNGPTIVQSDIDACNEQAQQTQYNALLFGQNTVIKALDTSTGRVKWTDVSKGTTLGSIAEANGVVYQGNLAGQLRMLDAKSGTILNVFSMGSPGETLLAAPITVADGSVFIGQGIDDNGPTNGIAVFGLL